MADSYEDEEEGTAKAATAIDQGERAQFRQELLNDINSDLSSFGLKVVSVSLQKIWDTSNYIANLAQKTLVQMRQQVEIEEARLRARADKSESDAERRVKLERSKADEQIIAAREKLEVYRRESVASIEQGRLEADHSIEEARNRGEQQIQQLSRLLEAYKRYAQGLTVDSLVVMDDESGFNGAVNRGPAAFTEFLKQFDGALGIDIRRFVSGEREAQV